MHILLCGPSNENTGRTTTGLETMCTCVCVWFCAPDGVWETGLCYDNQLWVFRNLIWTGTYSGLNCVGMLHTCTSDTVGVGGNEAGAAAGQDAGDIRDKIRCGTGRGVTFLSSPRRVSALWGKPAGRPFCSRGCGVLIRHLERPGSALPCEGVLSNRSKTVTSLLGLSAHSCSFVWGFQGRLKWTEASVNTNRRASRKAVAVGKNKGLLLWPPNLRQHFHATASFPGRILFYSPSVLHK